MKKDEIKMIFRFKQRKKQQQQKLNFYTLLRG